MNKLFFCFRRQVLIFGLASLQFSAYADGLSDLNEALSSIDNQATINAQLTYTTKNTRDDGDETKERKGKVTVNFYSDETGLKIQYDDDVIALLEQETKRRAQDEDADTPTLRALNGIDAVDINRIINGAFGLQRLLQQATFIDEQAVTLDGRALRQLNFTLPLDTLITDKQTRKYVRKFSNSYQIIIDDNGIPLESHLVFEGKGRAYIVLRVEASGETHASYRLHNGRLIRTELTAINRWDSTFGSGEQVDEEVINIMD